MQRYEAYVAAFGPGEEWLQRKVKEEVGSQLITIKQRCAGLDPEWNKVRWSSRTWFEPLRVSHIVLLSSVGR